MWNSEVCENSIRVTTEAFGELVVGLNNTTTIPRCTTQVLAMYVAMENEFRAMTQLQFFFINKMDHVCYRIVYKVRKFFCLLPKGIRDV